MRNPKDKDQVINSCTFFYTEEGFVKDQPIHLEIGMGKGKFLLEMALNNPQINFIGVEKYAAVASYAIKKIAPYHLPNLKILIMDAENLKDLLAHQVTTIYLNFSDPWPKKRHAKRRLTSPEYLKSYETLFKTNATIIQKTDNDALFAYSLETLKAQGYEIAELSYDLAKENKDNVLTEYEAKFQEQGIKIKYLKAIKKVKKIIFDLDNTLIKFDHDPYLLAYEQVLKKHHIPHSSEDLYAVIAKYEDTVSKYDKNQMQSFIAEAWQCDLPASFTKDLCSAIGTYWVKEKDLLLIEVLTYLKKNYDLYVLTNFFTDVQEKRLEHMGILKYFKKVVGSERFVKPNPAAFKAFCEDVDPSECLVIGDSLDHDLKPALNLGMKGLHFTKYLESSCKEVPQIKNWNELKNML